MKMSLEELLENPVFRREDCGLTEVAYAAYHAAREATEGSSDESTFYDRPDLIEVEVGVLMD